MSFMADLFGLMWRHPIISCLSLMLFTPPFYPVLRFFSPLLISTAVFVVVVVSFGPALERKVHRDGEAYAGGARGRQELRENRRGFWEEEVKPQTVERTWLDGLVYNLKTRLHAWLEQTLRNDHVLDRLQNEGQVSLPVEAEREASRSGSGSSRRSSMKSGTSDKDGSTRRPKEVRSTDTDDESPDEEDDRSTSGRRIRSSEVTEVRSIGKNGPSDESGHFARSRSSSRRRREGSQKAASRSRSRSNSVRGVRYEGNTEQVAAARPAGEEAVAVVGRRERSRSKSRAQSFKYAAEDTDFDTEEDARLQAEAVTRHQRSMTKSRSNSGKTYDYYESTDLNTDEDARLQQEAVERQLRAKLRTRSSRRQDRGLDSEEDTRLEPRSRSNSRSNPAKGMMASNPQVALVDTDSSDDEPRLVPVTRLPSSSRPQSRSKGSTVGPSGSDRGTAKFHVQAGQAGVRSGSPSGSRSSSGNETRSETDHVEYEGRPKDEASAGEVIMSLEEDGAGSHAVRSKLPPLQPAAGEVRPVHDEQSAAGQGSTWSAEPAWTDGSSSEEEGSAAGASPVPTTTTALPGRLVRALSRELKAHIDEKLVVPSEQPEKKMERLQTLHHEISGILNNFSIHEEEERLASVLGGLTAFVQGESKDEVPRTDLLPKRWTSKTYSDVDILPQTPSVKRLTDSDRDSQKLEMLKLYGHLLQAERDNLTRQDTSSSLA